MEETEKRMVEYFPNGFEGSDLRPPTNMDMLDVRDAFFRLLPYGISSYSLHISPDLSRPPIFDPLAHLWPHLSLDRKLQTVSSSVVHFTSRCHVRSRLSTMANRLARTRWLITDANAELMR